MALGVGSAAAFIGWAKDIKWIPALGSTPRGSVVLKGARPSFPSGTALSAGRTHIGGDLDCRDGLTALGTIDLSDARVGGSILLEAAELTAPGSSRTVLRADGIDAGGVLNLCDGFTAHGRITLNSATIRSSLCLAGALLDTAADEEALICRGSTAAVLSLQLREVPLGIIDLSRTRIALLQDEPTTWPASLVVEGAIYDDIRPALPAVQRLPWLGRDSGGLRLSRLSNWPPSTSATAGTPTHEPYWSPRSAACGPL